MMAHLAMTEIHNCVGSSFCIGKHLRKINEKMLRHAAVLVYVGGSVIYAAQAGDASRSDVLNIVFIGDSITEGNYLPQAPPVLTANWLHQHVSSVDLHFSNQGKSGHTTVDTLPETGTDFPEIEKAATQLESVHRGHLIFSVMLGTNDSAMDGTLGAPVSPENYRKNLSTTIDRLLKDYPNCTVILNRHSGIARTLTMALVILSRAKNVCENILQKSMHLLCSTGSLTRGRCCAVTQKDMNISERSIEQPSCQRGAGEVLFTFTRIPTVQECWEAFGVQRSRML